MNFYHLEAEASQWSRLIALVTLVNQLITEVSEQRQAGIPCCDVHSADE